MPRGFSGCVICNGKKQQPRNGKRGRTCTANECKTAYRDQRAQEAKEGLALGAAVAVQPVTDKMPNGMWVHEIMEILGERCCEPHKLSKKKRKGGPGSAYQQEFLVRGMFLEDDGDADDDEEDDTPEPNTFWVEQTQLLETISKEDVVTALQERHQSVIDDL